MAVTYPRDMRKRANDDGNELATISAGGMEYQGPVTAEQADEILKFFTKWYKKHNAPKESSSVKNKG